MKCYLIEVKFFTYVVKFCALYHAHCITQQTYLKEMFADIDVNVQSLVESNQHKVLLVCNMPCFSSSVNWISQLMTHSGRVGNIVLLIGGVLI